MFTLLQENDFVIEQKIHPAVNQQVKDIRRLRIKGKGYNLLRFLIALGYGVILSQIPSDHFKDFSNYLAYGENSWLRLLSLFSEGVLPTLFNEPVWLFINSALGAFLVPETAVRTIIFLSASSVAWLVLRTNPRHFVWLLVFLLLPAILKNHLVHLRQGTAIAVFLWGWFSHHKVYSWALIALTPFIHASFFFVLIILGMARTMTRIRLGPDIRTLAFITAGILISVSLAWIAAFLGARQAQVYDFNMADVSGLGFILWLAIFGIMATEGRRYLHRHAFESGMILFYLGTYWLIEITARIFEGGMLLVLLAGLRLTGWRRLAFLSIIISYGILAWTMRMGQPALGFGKG